MSKLNEASRGLDEMQKMLQGRMDLAILFGGVAAEINRANERAANAEEKLAKLNADLLIRRASGG